MFQPFLGNCKKRHFRERPEIAAEKTENFGTRNWQKQKKLYHRERFESLFLNIAPSLVDRLIPANLRILNSAEVRATQKRDFFGVRCKTHSWPKCLMLYINTTVNSSTFKWKRPTWKIFIFSGVIVIWNRPIEMKHPVIPLLHHRPQ